MARYHNMHLFFVFISFVQSLYVLLPPAFYFFQHVIVPEQHFTNVSMVLKRNCFNSIRFFCLFLIELKKQRPIINVILLGNLNEFPTILEALVDQVKHFIDWFRKRLIRLDKNLCIFGDKIFSTSKGLDRKEMGSFVYAEPILGQGLLFTYNIIEV